MAQGQSAQNLTLAYYAQHAHEFAAATTNVEFHDMQNRFTALLASGAHILDFGCGSGRDTKQFLQEGFQVTAIDGSPELCDIAHRLTGIPVRNELFQDLEDMEAYDGIWACSSILHLPKNELASVLFKMVRALKPHGIIYTSFKHGSGEETRGGRHFTNFTEPEFRQFISAVSNLSIREVWTSHDVRPGRESERWLNVLLQKG